MKTAVIRQKAESFCVYSLNLLCLLLFAYLFCGSFAFSWLNQELSDKFVYLERDSLAGSLLFSFWLWQGGGC